MLAWTGMNINTNKIYISWLRRWCFAFRWEHCFRDSCSVPEAASSTLPREWVGKSSGCSSCLWSGISETANVSRVRMLELSRLRNPCSADQDTSCLLKSTAELCSANEAFLRSALSGWIPLGCLEKLSLCALLHWQYWLTNIYLS